MKLKDYSAIPLYNIKAVVQITGISSSTLRAWERRYQVCLPSRSQSGYRLYSERDITILSWFKAQVDAGMSVSRVVVWLRQMEEEVGGLDDVVLKTIDLQALLGSRNPSPSQQDKIRNFAVLSGKLVDALSSYQEVEAEKIIGEAFSMYTMEQVGEELFTPVLIEIGRQWQNKALNVTREHFASNYLLQRLFALLRSIPNMEAGPIVWVGCAPGELHQGATLLLSIYLRRAGYFVYYLGQSLCTEDLYQDIAIQRPDALLLSASSCRSAKEMQKMIVYLNDLSLPSLAVGYGGRIFQERPELCKEIDATYLGDSAVVGVNALKALLA